MAIDTRQPPNKLSDNFDTDATEPAPGRRHPVELPVGWRRSQDEEEEEEDDEKDRMMRRT
jgi:hypothetical protein